MHIPTRRRAQVCTDTYTQRHLQTRDPGRHTQALDMHGHTDTRRFATLTDKHRHIQTYDMHGHEGPRH